MLTQRCQKICIFIYNLAQQLNAQDCGVSTATGTEQYQNLCSTPMYTNRNGQPALPGSLAWQVNNQQFQLKNFILMFQF